MFLSSGMAKGIVGSEGPYPERVAYNRERNKTPFAQATGGDGVVVMRLLPPICRGENIRSMRWGNDGFWSMGSVDTRPARDGCARFCAPGRGRREHH